MQSVFLLSTSQFIAESHSEESKLKNLLKQQFNINSRRTSRLALLSLLGALSIEKINAHCGVYVTSIFSSPSNMYELEMDIFQRKTPRPFNFINSINNAISFYVADALKVNGPNIFISTDICNWSQILLPAITDLQEGVVDQALVGWCYESRRYDEYSKEGSFWLLLTRHPDTSALASLTIANKPCQGDVSNQPIMTHANYFYDSVLKTFDLNSQPNCDVISVDLILNKLLLIKKLPLHKH
ncbi:MULTISPECIES: hypothetical protein [unclassified Gilliamella]|uniref:hypothetical protein n=1 Tax=unclassified Gilliamella TaxID=2685620 RepID=UPI002269C6E8|nr:MULTISPECIES: hypothetical protein [unclassified Gilliamella]MCX8587605.1 hypothetical protein [Gilliamella sp. B3801]MCX8591783.1 hypothetical protein [Gilliamella sp. B3804]